jgi:hypothetical protein
MQEIYKHLIINYLNIFEIIGYLVQTPSKKCFFSEKLSFFSDSERSEESEIFDKQRFRFFASLRMTTAPTN